MNFLDTYDLTQSTTPPPPSESNQPEPTLNEEVNQVIGQLGRLWGGVRRQSQSAFETARKDLTGVVSQAQKELGKFTGDALRESQPEENTDNTNPPPPDADADADSQIESSSEADTPLAASTSSESHPDLSASSLFSRLQSALPPNIVSTVQTTVQNTLPFESIKHATENIDLAQLRATLTSEFHRVQDVAGTRAGEYVQKSEEMLREAMKEAGEVLRDAVKVIPPEDVASGSGVVGAGGMVWDGSDIWMLPTPVGDYFDGAGKGKGKESTPSSGRPSGEAQRAVATRAGSLLKQLKHNPEIIKHDPEADTVVQEWYLSWIKTEVDVKEGGIDGEEWSAKANSLLDEPLDGPALRASQDALVPSDMTKEIFWKRFFFRVYQIEREEAKRKALLQSSMENEEVFSWEDEEEEATSVAKKGIAPNDHLSPVNRTGQRSPKVPEVSGTDPMSPTHTHAASPRAGSEESYDLLSSENGSVSGDRTRTAKQTTGDDPDSDWE